MQRPTTILILLLLSCVGCSQSKPPTRLPLIGSRYTWQESNLDSNLKPLDTSIQTITISKELLSMITVEKDGDITILAEDPEVPKLLPIVSGTSRLHFDTTGSDSRKIVFDTMVCDSSAILKLQGQEIFCDVCHERFLKTFLWKGDTSTEDERNTFWVAPSLGFVVKLNRVGVYYDANRGTTERRYSDGVLKEYQLP